MSKKNKNFVKNFRNDSPDVCNMDEIGYMVDEEIHNRVLQLEFEKNKLTSMGKDSYLWEVELAYLQREQELRTKRAELHVNYLKKFMVCVETTSMQESNIDSCGDLN